MYKRQIQSMTNTDTKDARATIAQIKELEKAGCEIVRCAVYDEECAAALREVREQISIPLVADVHFDAMVAVAAIETVSYTHLDVYKRQK